MATPTDQRDRARHPEDFGRPDDRLAEIMRTWTGIGAPADKYEWGNNPTHSFQSSPGAPVGRPTEELKRPPTIVEYIPIRQEQKDPWSLTEPKKVRVDETHPLKPIEDAPVSTNPIVEFMPLRQRQKDPWSITTPSRVSSTPGSTALGVPKTS